MATKVKTPIPVEPTPVDEQALIIEQTAVDTNATQAADEYERLLAERKAMQARIKQLKAAQPEQSNLEREIAKQKADNGGAWVATVIGHRVQRRVKYGQPLAEALDAVLAQYRQLVLAALAPANGK